MFMDGHESRVQARGFFERALELDPGNIDARIGAAWVDVAKLKLAEGSAPARLDLSGHPILSGEVSAQFVNAEPFKFLSH